MAKDALYAQVARMGKAVASPRRLELLDLLGQAPRTVEGLAAQARMSVANTSQHLQVLRAAGLVDATKHGLFVTYRLASDDVAELFLRLRRLAESRLEDVQSVKRRFFSTTDDLEVITGKQLLERVRRGRAIVVDVRPADEYAAGHLRGALSIPHDELKRRFDELPKDRRIVAYCRGPYCVYAAQAVKVLRARGFDAVRIEDGVAEWRAQGLPITAAGR
jgi:rhodanese-related sulfurtransferase/DNA-binding transcriptional ArsR family regulator